MNPTNEDREVRNETIEIISAVFPKPITGDAFFSEPSENAFRPTVTKIARTESGKESAKNQPKYNLIFLRLNVLAFTSIKAPLSLTPKPCTKSNDDLAKATFTLKMAKAKNARAFGVRCTGWFDASRFFDIS